MSKKIINVTNIYLFNKEKVLLIYKENGSKKWYAPGGKIESYNIKKEAIREFKEETNLIIKKENLNKKIFNKHIFDNKIVKINSFFVNNYEGKLIHKNREGILKWIDLKEINNLDMLKGDKIILMNFIKNKNKKSYFFKY